MRIFLAVLTFTFAASSVCAQNEAPQEGSRGLAGLLERSLSNENMQVRVEGLQGALSAAAQIERLSFSDREGVWLVIEDAVLDWNRTALLRGRVDVNRLEAQKITLERTPMAAEDPGLPDPAARSEPFSLPELPVAIEIDAVAAPEIVLGEAILGEEVIASLDGTLQLAGGDARVTINLQRTDVAGTSAMIDAGFSNETTQLDVALELIARPGGLIVTRLGIPDSPGLDLTVDGSGPLNDFVADIALRSDNAVRLGGTVTLRDADEEPARIIADISGDVRPLLSPDISSFFGSETAIRFSATANDDGSRELEGLHITAEAFDIAGKAKLDDSGWPARLALVGVMGRADGQDVRLPVSGTPLLLNRARLAVNYDAELGSVWSAVISTTGLSQDAIGIDAVDLRGAGTVTRPTETEPGGLEGSLLFGANGIDLGDDALNQAAGDDIRLSTDFAWQVDDDFAVSDLMLDAGGASFGFDGILALTEENLPASGTLSAELEDLSRFAALAGQTMGGSLSLTADGSATLLTGAFELDLDGTGRDLVTGIAEVDQLLLGTADIALSATRDTDGLSVTRASARTPAVEFSAKGDSSSSLTADLRLDDLGRILPDVSGPLTMSAELSQVDNDLALSDVKLNAEGAVLDFDGALWFTRENLPVNGSLKAELEDLSQFAALIGQELAGSLSLNAEGSATLQAAETFDLNVEGTGRNLITGITEVDQLLLGTADIAFSATRDIDGISVRRASARTPAVEFSAEGDSSSSLSTDLRLDDLGRILPDVSGPLTMSAELSQVDNDLALSDVKLNAEGAVLDFDGALWLTRENLPVEGTLQAELEDLSRFAALTGQALAGSLSLDAEGSATLQAAETFDLTVEGTGRNLTTGIAPVDQLLLGSVDIALSAERDLDGFLVRNASARTAALDFKATGDSRGGGVTANLRLDDLARLTPDFPGPVAIDAKLERRSGQIGVALEGTGPAGSALSGSGSVAPDFSTLDLALKANGRMALANPVLQPLTASGVISADLTISGPPELSSVSGSITVSEARIAEPTVGLALQNLTGSVDLSGASARVSVSGQGNRGGSLAVNGTASLAAPVSSDLAILLDRFVVEVPGALTTSISTDLGLVGAFPNNAELGGTITLGQTEIRIPEGGSPDAITEGIVHIGDTTGARTTRERAGIGETRPEPPAAPGTSRGLGLDLNILANNKVFVRGFGLDAEVGGEIAVAGTTDDPRPVGEIELVRGRMAVLGQRLDLDEGRIQLLASLIPELYFAASSTSDEATVTVAISGPANEPEFSVTSSPPLPEDEALAQLLFGRSLNELSGFQALQLANSIVALRNGGGLGFINQLREGTGLDDLDLDSDDEGNTNLRVGKYLTEDIYTNVDVNSSGQTGISLNIDLTNALTARGTVTNDGDDSLGLFFERDY